MGPNKWDVILPIDELHHFSRWAHCTTRLLAIINHIITININHILTVYYTNQMVNVLLLYSGKHTKNYGKSPLLMGKSSINVIRMGTLHHQPTGPHPLQVFCQPPPPEPALDTVPPQRSFDPRLAFHRDPGDGSSWLKRGEKWRLRHGKTSEKRRDFSAGKRMKTSWVHWGR